MSIACYLNSTFFTNFLPSSHFSPFRIWSTIRIDILKCWPKASRSQHQYGTCAIFLYSQWWLIYSLAKTSGTPCRLLCVNVLGWTHRHTFSNTRTYWALVLGRIRESSPEDSILLAIFEGEREDSIQRTRNRVRIATIPKPKRSKNTT
jgi:hypothetical protein